MGTCSHISLSILGKILKEENYHWRKGITLLTENTIPNQPSFLFFFFQYHIQYLKKKKIMGVIFQSLKTYSCYKEFQLGK